MWASLAAVYPEMQDWVARRGHGGAAVWTSAGGVAAVQAAGAQADLVVVQLHAGYQFINVGSDTVHMIARQAIDAGADIVIAHHPHVLQGFEFYKGHLIAYSMGNFVFDQDFLATFASVFLRTIWDGNQLLEARLVPIEISGYRPVPVTDQAARNNLFTAWERSVTNTTSSKDDVGVRAFPSTTDGDTQVAHIVVEHDTGRLTPTAPTPQPVHVDLPAGGVVPIGFDGLVQAQLGQPSGATDVLVGKDTFGWGRFENETVDDPSEGATHWNLDSCQEAAMQTGGATGNGYLRLVQRNQAMNVLMRPVAQVKHRCRATWCGSTTCQDRRLDAARSRPELLDPPARSPLGRVDGDRPHRRLQLRRHQPDRGSRFDAARLARSPVRRARRRAVARARSARHAHRPRHRLARGEHGHAVLHVRLRTFDR